MAIAAMYTRPSTSKARSPACAPHWIIQATHTNAQRPRNIGAAENFRFRAKIIAAQAPISARESRKASQSTAKVMNRSMLSPSNPSFMWIKSWARAAALAAPARAAIDDNSNDKFSRNNSPAKEKNEAKNISNVLAFLDSNERPDESCTAATIQDAFG